MHIDGHTVSYWATVATAITVATVFAGAWWT